MGRGGEEGEGRQYCLRHHLHSGKLYPSVSTQHTGVSDRPAVISTQTGQKYRSVRHINKTDTWRHCISPSDFPTANNYTERYCIGLSDSPTTNNYTERYCIGLSDSPTTNNYRRDIVSVCPIAQQQIITQRDLVSVCPIDNTGRHIY